MRAPPCCAHRFLYATGGKGYDVSAFGIRLIIAVLLGLAFAVAAWRVPTRRPSVHLAAGGCVLTAAFGVAAFS